MRITRRITFGLCMLSFTLLAVSNGCKQKKQDAEQATLEETVTLPAPDSSFRLFTYGLPQSEEVQNATALVGAKWGIFYHSVGGCMVSEQLTDSVSKRNDSVRKRLVRAYGADWEDRFDKEVATEAERIKLATSILRKESLLTAKDEELGKEGNGLGFSCSPLGSRKYLVSVDGWGKFNGKTARLQYYQYLVDIKRKHTTLISDTAIVLYYDLP